MFSLGSLPVDVLFGSIRPCIGLVSYPIGSRMVSPVQIGKTPSADSPIQTGIQSSFIRGIGIIRTYTHITFHRVAVPIVQVRKAGLGIGLIGIDKILRR